MHNFINRKRLVSGIQPTNKLTLGNYLGAIQHYVALQDEYDSYLFVADYHSITNLFEPKELQKAAHEIIKYYVACGVDLNKTTLYYQSAIKPHLELTYLLSVHTTIGELSRMTQFKDKSQNLKLQNKTLMVPTGLLIYPILMAADILIYDADLVPVGHDQKQHLELTRNIAERMNKKYGKKIFQIPEPYVFNVASRIMDLVNPTIKMSKSNNNINGVIFLNDDLQIAYKKIMGAKTDSVNKINYDFKTQPGISNLIEILAGLEKTNPKAIVEKYQHQTYLEFKTTVAEAVIAILKIIQNNYKNLNLDEIQKNLEYSQNKCYKIATEKIDKVQKILGLYSKIREK